METDRGITKYSDETVIPVPLHPPHVHVHCWRTETLP